MTLSPLNRKIAVARLRASAIAHCRENGCTCDPEPEMTLGEKLHGPHQLPMWTSLHSEDCPLGRALRDAGCPSGGRVLVYTPSRPGPQG